MNMKEQLAMQALYNRRVAGADAFERTEAPAKSTGDGGGSPSRTDVARMNKAELVEELRKRDMGTDGNANDLRDSLLDVLFG